MPHAFGSLAFPFAAPDPDPAVALGDPGVDVFADFFSKVLTADAAALWNTAFPGEPVVKSVRKYNPEDAAFNESDLPALYVWRERGTDTQVADGRNSTTDTLHLLWVPDPPRNTERTARQSQFFNAFEKSIAFASGRGMHPAYKHADDATTSGAAYGSVVRKFAGVAEWKLNRVDRSGLDVKVKGTAGSEIQRYPALSAEFSLVETSSFDPIAGGFSVPGPLDLQLTVPAEPPDLPDPLVLQHAQEPP